MAIPRYALYIVNRAVKTQFAFSMHVHRIEPITKGLQLMLHTITWAYFSIFCVKRKFNMTQISNLTQVNSQLTTTFY